MVLSCRGEVHGRAWRKQGCLKIFTFLPIAEIDALMAEHAKAPEKRLAQKELAEEMTNLVHGKEATAQAISASNTLYGSSNVETLDGRQQHRAALGERRTIAS